MSMAQRDTLSDPCARVYRQLERDIGLYVHGHELNGHYVPASLDVTFRSAPFCCLAKRPDNETSNLSVASEGTTTHQLIDKLCAEANVSEDYQNKLRDICHKYGDIFNDGSRPLAKTNLTKFVVELSEQRRPLSCAPRMVSHAKREEIKKIVEQGLNEGDVNGPVGLSRQRQNV